MTSLPFNYIIVGSGTAGSLLANRLSNIGKRVLIVEAGPSNKLSIKSLPGMKGMTPWLHVPLGYLHTMTDPRTSWNYTTPIKQTMEDGSRSERYINYPRGKVLGGCSSINGMIYMKGNKGDYNGWNEVIKGREMWGEDDMGRAFGRIEELGWPKERQRLSWEVLDDFAKGVSEVRGVPVMRETFDNSEIEAVGYFNVNQNSGRRVSAWQCFVDDGVWGEEEERRVLKGGNLTVQSNATVKGLVFEDQVKEGGMRDKVIGIEWWRTENDGTVDDSKVHREIVGGEVILSAGAIGSPQILQVSGIGSGRTDDRVELPGVGKNLHDHLQLRSVYRLKKGTVTLNETSKSIAGQLKIGMDYILNRTGPLSMAPSQLGAFLKSSPSLSYPDLQYHCQPLSLPAFGSPLHDFPGFTAAICNLRPTSRGSVNAKGTDVRDGVDIDNNYLATSNDREIAVQGLRITRDIVMGAMGGKYQPEEILPGEGLTTEQELADASTRIGTSIFHPVGTCRMGSSEDEMAVLDEECRVRGVEGLRVVDASAMPRITSGNTNTPTMALAERWVEMHVGRSKRW